VCVLCGWIGGAFTLFSSPLPLYSLVISFLLMFDLKMQKTNMYIEGTGVEVTQQHQEFH
jgi:hypothetical protein